MITALLLSLSLHAQSVRGPISSALGGSGVAGMPAAEAALLNPALVAVFPGTSVDLSYRDGALDEGQHRTALMAGAIDNGKDELFSGAVHYVRARDTGRADQPNNGELWHAAFASRVSENFAFGISGYRLTGSTFSSTPQWNVGVGTLVMLKSWLGLAYVAKNLALPSDRVPAGLREDFYHALGFQVGMSDFARLRFDVGRRERMNPRGSFAYLLGFESKTTEWFLIRLGFRHDEAGDGRLLTAGLGFDGPKIKLDYALETPVDAADGALHSVDLRIPF